MSDTIITRLLRLAARAWDAQVRAYRVLDDRREPWEAERAPAVDHDATPVAVGERSRATRLRPDEPRSATSRWVRAGGP